MRKLVLAALILAVTASAADARRRHYRYYIPRHAPVMMMAPDFAEPRSSRGRIEHPAQLIPRDWQLQPADERWKGRRYIAPDGNAWVAFYAINAANDSQARFQAVAFGDGEQVTYLHGTRDRLTVSGLKGDRIYYRKVMLACGGTAWRHLALEYPADAKSFDRLVERLSRSFDRIAEEDCGGDLFSAPQPASASPAPPKPEDTKPAQPN